MIASYSSSRTTPDVGCAWDTPPACSYFSFYWFSVTSVIIIIISVYVSCAGRQSEEEEGPGLPWEPRVNYQDK